jgi:hypothetical protein
MQVVPPGNRVRPAGQVVAADPIACSAAEIPSGSTAMNLYFACSITGGREKESIYQVIIRTLLQDGHQVPTAHLAGSDILDLEAVAGAGQIYERDVAWIRNCDALIAEVSTPSHGVGYEIGYALSRGKEVLCLHQVGIRVSKMIIGNPDPHLHIASYQDPGEAIGLMRAFLAGKGTAW